MGANEYLAKKSDVVMLTQNFEQYKMEQRSTYLGDKVRDTEDSIRAEYNLHYREMRTIQQICDLNLVPDLCNRLRELTEDRKKIDKQLERE